MLNAEKPGDEGFAPSSHRPRVSSSGQQEHLEDTTAKANPQASAAMVGALLESIVVEINAAHDQAHGAARTAIEHAIKCGHLLNEASKTIDHGGWLKWIEANLKFGARQAQKYMRLADHAGELPDANSNSYLNIDGALKLIAKTRAETEVGTDVVPVPTIVDVSPTKAEAPTREQQVELDESERNTEFAEKLRAAEITIVGLESEVEELKAENAELRRQIEVFKSPVRCDFVKDDGGRAAAGYGGPSGDCVARAIAIATGKPYAEVFKALEAAHARHVKRLGPDSYAAGREMRRRTKPIHNGCDEDVYGPYLISLGWQYTRVRERLYLRAGALPAGRLIIHIDHHLVALIDGTIRDTYDSGGHGKRPVEGWWSQAAEVAA